MNDGSKFTRHKLGDITESIEYGLTASANREQIGPRFLRITDIQDEMVQWDKVPYCECPEAEMERYTLRKGDIVFARTGATTGKSYLIRECPEPAVFASYLIRVRPSLKVVPEFLSQFLRTRDYWRQISEAANGSTLPGVNGTTLRKLSVPLPQLPEQRRIASILDKADRLRRIRRYALELGASLLPAAFLRYFGDPVTNPKGWGKLPFEQVAPSRLGKMLDAKQQTGKHTRPYLRNENVQWDRFDLTDVSVMDFDDSDRAEFGLVPGDLMICEGGEPGRCAIWRGEIGECYFQKALHRARPISSKATPEYLLHLMWSLAQRGGFADHVTSSTIAHLTGEKLKRMVVPVPPLSLQWEFTALVKRTDHIRQVQRETLRQAEHLFRTLLHRAFTTGL